MYEFEVKVTQTHYFTVEAADENEAEEKACGMIIDYMPDDINVDILSMIEIED